MIAQVHSQKLPGLPAPLATYQLPLLPATQTHLNVAPSTLSKQPVVFPSTPRTHLQIPAPAGIQQTLAYLPAQHAVTPAVLTQPFLPAQYVPKPSLVTHQYFPAQNSPKPSLVTNQFLLAQHSAKPLVASQQYLPTQLSSKPLVASQQYFPTQHSSKPLVASQQYLPTQHTSKPLVTNHQYLPTQHSAAPAVVNQQLLPIQHASTHGVFGHKTTPQLQVPAPAGLHQQAVFLPLQQKPAVHSASLIQNPLSEGIHLPKHMSSHVHVPIVDIENKYAATGEYVDNF